MYILDFLLLQNVKKSLGADLELRGCAIFAICPGQNFVGTNHYYYFHLSIRPFHCAKL